MTHFACVVIGSNVDEQLAPYDQNLPVTTERLELDVQQAREFLMEESKSGAAEALAVDETNERAVMMFLYGDDIRQDKEGWYQLHWVNPKAKWDCWTIGGRWAGRLKLKKRAKPGWVDQAVKGDIDWEGMEEAAEAKARDRYRKVHAIIDGQPPMEPLEFVRDRHWKGIPESDREAINAAVQKARDEYEAQSGIVALRQDEELRWVDADDYLPSEDEYARKCRRSRAITFAVLKEGEWYESAAWEFGTSSENTAVDEWREEWYRLLEGVEDDTLITICDLHI